MSNPGREMNRLRWPDRLTARETARETHRLIVLGGWTRKQIADACGVTVNAVCQWINGQRCGPKKLKSL